MEKRISKIEIISIILFICSIIFFVLSYFFNKQALDFKNKYKKEENIFYLNNAKKDKYDFDLFMLNKEIDVYNNLDKAIDDEKKLFFKNLKDLEDKILSGESNRKIAYITFDDGPYYNTHKVLDILDQNDVKATFFTISMNGEYCYDNKSANCFEMYKEYLKRGHTIANHTYTHAIFGGLYSSVDSFMDAIVRQEDHIRNLTGGYTTNITRFPGGSSTAKGHKEGIMQRLRERGYGWVDWTAQDGDGKALSSTDEAWNNLVSSLDSNIEVILFHDYSAITTAILPDAIKYMKSQGYELYPLFYESNMISK